MMAERGGRRRKDKLRENRGASQEDDETLSERANAMMARVLEETVYRKPLKKEMMIILQDLCKIYSPTGHEQPVIDYCVNALRGAGLRVHIGKGNNVFAVRPNPDGSKVVCINAHTDTVQVERDKGIAESMQYRWYDDIYTGNGKMLGGDDKCGIAVALTLALYTDFPMKIILTAGEEVGGTGAAELIKSDFNDVAFCFTVDRRGGTDIISSYCGRTCAPKTFVDQFTALAHRTVGIKFVDVEGSYADTYTICEFTPCINISAGYYNAHTPSDFIDAGELYGVMLAIKAAMENIHELNAAIERAGADWFKDKYANNPLYKRGKYVGGVTYTWGGGWESYGMGGYGIDVQRPRDVWDVYGNRSPRLPNTAGTSVQKPITFQQDRVTTRKEDIEAKKNESKKCHINFDNVVGRDDKVDDTTDINGHLKSIMSMHEGILLAAYNDGKTSDEKWDEYMAMGEIQPFVHRIGVEQRVRLRNAQLAAKIVRENRAARQKDIPDNAPIHRDPNALEQFEDYFNDSTEYVGGEEEKLGTDPGQTASWAMKDAIDMDAVEELNDIGMNSGFMPGSVEHSVFVDYVTGNTTIDELRYYVETNMIVEDVFDRAVEGRKEYEAELRLKRIQKTEAEELSSPGWSVRKNAITGKAFGSAEEAYRAGLAMAKERHGEVEHPGKAATTRDREIRRKKKKKVDEGNFPSEHYSDVEKKLIRRFALGYITTPEWDYKRDSHEFSESTYEAGKREREFFDVYGKLSGNFEDSQERSKKQFIEEHREVKDYSVGFDEDEKDMIVKYARGEITYLTWEELRILGHIEPKVFEEGLSARLFYVQFRRLPPGFGS